MSIIHKLLAAKDARVREAVVVLEGCEAVHKWCQPVFESEKVSEQMQEGMARLLANARGVLEENEHTRRQRELCGMTPKPLEVPSMKPEQVRALAFPHPLLSSHPLHDPSFFSSTRLRRRLLLLLGVCSYPSQHPPPFWCAGRCRGGGVA